MVIPAGAWFAAEVTSSGSFALVGCTVAPGFDYSDFELADREELAPKQKSYGVKGRRHPSEGDIPTITLS